MYFNLIREGNSIIINRYNDLALTEFDGVEFQSSLWFYGVKLNTSDVQFGDLRVERSRFFINGRSWTTNPEFEQILIQEQIV